MALDDATKTLIRMYLGWPARFRQSDSALELALGYLDTDTTLQAQVTGSIIPAIQDIDSRLHGGSGSVGALERLQFSKAGEVETNAMEIVWLRSEGRRHVNRLSSLLAVPVREDVFGPSRGVNRPHSDGGTSSPLPGWVRRR